MSEETLQKLRQSLHQGVPQASEDAWVKVGLDTGGIAAGADRMFAMIEEEVNAAALDFPVRRVGSYGFAYMDPLVEVSRPQEPAVLYGMVNEESARAIVREHLAEGRMVDDHVVASRRYGDSLDSPTTHILVQDTSREGGDKTDGIGTALRDELKTHGLDGQIQVVRALDMGIYGEGVVLQLFPSQVTYCNVLSSDIPRVVEESLARQKVVEDLHWTRPHGQLRIVLRNCGVIDPESLDDALRHGSYHGFTRALAEGDPDFVIETIKKSELRGRGGAGFPTGLKWELTRRSQGERKFIICNADEGDPGAFMDRSVLEGDPHAVLEGLMLAAYAIGATEGYFYIRAEYPLAIKRVTLAIEQARERGLLGKNILGSGWDFDVHLRLGAGAFVCGEETALIASMEGRRGSPEPRPPFPSVKGLWGMPTCINNVETLAAVPWIVDQGAEAYAAHGMDKSRGTKVFAVTGKLKNPQLVEVPMGTTVHDIVYNICGGVQNDVPIKGVQTGGPSGGIISEKHLETPITYETLQALGSIMGSGGMLILDENDCMVDVSAFYLKFCVDESCGKCAPCRVGGYQMLQLIIKISRGRGTLDDLEQVRRICTAMQTASLCGLGQTAPNPVLSSLRYFEEEFIAYIEGGTAYARKRKKALSEGKSLKEAV
ncbi:MAG: NADH-ubiquinone oxidoreductase-F iron-sulfur binding region domain-containing protein [Opitutales bacterium]